MHPSSYNSMADNRYGKGVRITLLGSGVNLFLVFIKFTAGLVGNSQALMADAIHSLSDLFTDAFVLFGLHMGRKAPDETHHFGHARLETLVSSIIGIILLGVGGYMGFKAGWSIYFHNAYHPSWLAFSVAVVSIIFKEALYHYTIAIGRRIKSASVVANAWHHRSDALSSVAVALGIAGAKIRPGWYILDAFAALVVSLLIIGAGSEILWKALRELTDTAPMPDVQKRIRDCAADVEGVLDVHDLRARSSGGLFLMELHVVVDGGLTVTQGHRIAKEVEACLVQELGNVGEVIVHVDPALLEGGKEREILG